MVEVQVVGPTEPVIILNGQSNMNAEAGQPFVDPFGTIVDPIEGNLTAFLASNAACVVNVNVLGAYVVTYYMTQGDVQGLFASNVTRTVRIVSVSRPVRLYDQHRIVLRLMRGYGCRF